MCFTFIKDFFPQSRMQKQNHLQKYLIETPKLLPKKQIFNKAAEVLKILLLKKKKTNYEHINQNRHRTGLDFKQRSISPSNDKF